MTTTREALNTLKVDDIAWNGREIIEVDSTVQTDKAFQTLVDQRILSVPIWDKTNQKYTGFFDASDMCSFVVATLRKSSEPDSDFPDMFSDLTHLMQTHNNMVVSEVQGASNASKNNPFIAVNEGMTLAKVVEILGERGVHRVPVLNLEGKILKIISQSELLKFLSENPASLKSLEGKTVGSSGLGIKDVITIGTDSPALRALELLDKHKLSSIAVVDRSTNKLAAQISNADLRDFISKKNITFFGINCMQFVSVCRSQDKDARPAVISATEDDDLISVVKRMVKARVHRVYLVDKHHQVIGVISIRDLLKYLADSTHMGNH